MLSVVAVSFVLLLGANASAACCVASDAPGCTNSACEMAVCAEDSFCCEEAWDACCVKLATEHCQELTGCSPTKPVGNCTLDSGSCCEANGSAGCEDSECCAVVCFQDPFCCDVEWDALCADAAMRESVCHCGGTSAPPLPPAFSCEENCGGAAPSGCWCDESCCDFGDCCEDKGQFCPGCDFGLGPFQFFGDWCEGNCGGTKFGVCWCDEACVENGDCCSGVCLDFECPELEICQSAPADLTGNGQTDVFDLLELLNNWGPCEYDRCFVIENCPGDFNHDHTVDVLDLLYLLENWG